MAENLELRREEVAGRIQQMTGRKLEDCRSEVDISTQRLFHWGAYCDKYGGSVQVRTFEPLGLALCNKYQRNVQITAAAQIAYPSKFQKFPTKLIKYHSQLDWNIHLHRLSARTASPSIACRGIGTAVMRNVTAHSILLQSEFSLFWTFSILSLYFSHKVDVCKYIDTKHHHQTPINKEFIDKYKIKFFVHQSSFCNNLLIYCLILFIFVSKWLFFHKLVRNI